MTGLSTGAEAPDFELRDQHGHPTRLSESRGRKALLVFFPFAFTSVCTSELDALRDAWPIFERHEVDIMAVSCDPLYTLRVFADQEGIAFPLLSDFWPHGAVASAYGVFDETRGSALRSSFIVDRAGVVVWAIHHEMPNPRNLADYTRVLDSLE